jgi:hypothetical protein
MADLLLYGDHVVVGEAEEIVPEPMPVPDRGEVRPLYKAKVGGAAGARLHLAAGSSSERSTRSSRDRVSIARTGSVEAELR